MAVYKIRATIPVSEFPYTRILLDIVDEKKLAQLLEQGARVIFKERISPKKLRRLYRKARKSN
jgi:hypothetical protein